MTLNLTWLENCHTAAWPETCLLLPAAGTQLDRSELTPSLPADSQHAEPIPGLRAGKRRWLLPGTSDTPSATIHAGNRRVTLAAGALRVFLGRELPWQGAFNTLPGGAAGKKPT